MTADPELILDAAGEVTSSDEYGVQILFEGDRFEIDREGRITVGWHFVYRLDSEAAIDGWSVVSRIWKPWYQDRPQIQARVIAVDGTVHELDPAVLGEYSADDDGPEVYGDTMTLRGPLPAVEVGAIVEEYHTVRDRQPGFSAGVVRSAHLARSVPIQRMKVEIEADAGIPLNFQVHHVDAGLVDKEVSDGVARVSLDIGPVEPWEEETSYAPGSVARRPVLRLSTGESWQTVATAYADLVDGQIEGSDIERVTRKIVGKEDDLGIVLALLLDHLRANVRYTGVEFGEQSVVPSAPAETLSRRFGDCKDKATLLVAMLRSLGIEAQVALVNTGPDNDVDPQLPGLGRFDHVIVHIPGDPEIWIDPTVEYARAGELPPWDRDRLALIAAPSTTELISTPPAVSGENLRKEEREVRLAREGGATIIESSTVTGWIEREYREVFGPQNETQRREGLEAYVENQYADASLDEFEISDTEDLSTPLTIRIVSKDCGTARTTVSEAAVAIELGSLVRNIPDDLRSVDEPDEDDETPEPRKHPFVLLEPVVVEITYRILPPPGYALAKLPESGERSLGPGTLTESYEVADDGIVTAELRFDSGKTVYSPEECEATKKAVSEFMEESKPLVTFDNIGERHLEAGRIREALAQFQSLVEEDPEEAIYRTEVARTYLAAGLGEAARTEAHRAVELAPDSVLARNTLGIILAHDELGRKFNAGFDPAGAEKAFRAAIELDPENFTANGELAILLEYDEDGNRYSEASRMDESIAIYETIRTELELENLTSNLMACQFYSGRFSDLRELWKEAPRETVRDALYLAATAADASVEDAIQEAARITDSPESYRVRLQGASEWLVRMRLYHDAAEILVAGSRGSTDSIQQLAKADVLRAVTHHEEIDTSLSDPKGVVRSFFVALITAEKADIEAVRHLLDPDLLEHADTEVLTDMLELNREVLGSAVSKAEISDDIVLDTALSLGSLTSTEASPTGVRVRFRPIGLDSSGAFTLDFYTVPKGETFALVGFTLSHSMIGEMLLRWIADDRSADVPRWLDWMVEELGQFGGGDVTDRHPLAWLWPPSSEGDIDPVLLETAAASLMVDGAYGDRPIEALQRNRERLAGEDAATGVDLALAMAGQAVEDWGLVNEAAERLSRTYPRSSSVFRTRILALNRLERYAEAETLLLDRLKKYPGEPGVQDVFCDLPQYTGDLVEYRRRLESAVNEGRASAGVINNLAWLDVVERKTTDLTRQLATRSVTMTDYSEPASLHTLATVYAELGMTTEARNVLFALLENRSSNDLEGPDWYVLGRIAEHYGAPEAAAKMYRKVDKPEDGEPEITSTFRLASNRLKAIEAPAKP
jgi:tetratricopeptide (TPR) repeat protein